MRCLRVLLVVLLTTALPHCSGSGDEGSDTSADVQADAANDVNADLSADTSPSDTSATGDSIDGEALDDAVAPDLANGDTAADGVTEDSLADADSTVQDSGPDPTGWDVVEVTTDDGAIIIEKIQYDSGGLNIFGQVCRPKVGGPWPAIVVNHGGWVGLLDEWNGGACADMARSGFVVLQSAYRGEDGSDGDVEICAGEVDDVLALIELARARTDLIDADRIAMWGISHGGCITLRAVARNAPVAVAVAAVPPIDWTVLHAFWEEGLAGSPTPAELAVWTALKEAVEGPLGGTPSTHPVAYAERSPITHIGDIVGSQIPTMVIHGGADFFVPYAQGCVLALEGFEARYVVDNLGTVGTVMPTDCVATGGTWVTADRPTGSWPLGLYYQMYDDMGHGLEGSTGAVGLADTLDFLVTRIGM